MLAKLSNRRGTDPYARWWGRGGVARRPPIPIVIQIEIALAIVMIADIGGELAMLVIIVAPDTD